MKGPLPADLINASRKKPIWRTVKITESGMYLQIRRRRDFQCKFK